MFTAYDPDPGDEDDPQTMNGYNYANNNPVMYVDPDGNWVWHVIGGILGAFSGYREAKSRGYSGWRMFGSILGGAALGTVGGFGFKVAKKAYKVVKYGKKLKFKDVKKRTSRYANYKANISRRQLKNRLKKNGWKKIDKYNYKNEEGKRVKGAVYAKRGRRINIRNYSKSSGATAEYYRPARKNHKIKFRLRR